MARRARVTTTVRDSDPGFKKLAAQLGEMGEITLGVQGKEAEQPHAAEGNSWRRGPGTLTVGQIAAIHELGIGVPERSWLRKWMDVNDTRLIAETKAMYQRVLKGEISRKKALQDLGYKWVEELREQFDKGTITPPISEQTVHDKNGETRPLVDTFHLRDSITYRAFLPNIKSIRNTAERMVLRKQK